MILIQDINKTILYVVYKNPYSVYAENELY